MLLIILGWSTAALRVDDLTYRMIIIYLNDKIGRFFGKNNCRDQQALTITEISRWTPCNPRKFVMRRPSRSTTGLLRHEPGLQQDTWLEIAIKTHYQLMSLQQLASHSGLSPLIGCALSSQVVWCWWELSQSVPRGFCSAHLSVELCMLVKIWTIALRGLQHALSEIGGLLSLAIDIRECRREWERNERALMLCMQTWVYRSVVRQLIPLDFATAPNVSNMRSPPPGYCLCRKAAAYCNSTGFDNVPV